LQDRICRRLEDLDDAKFREDSWERPGGGGGRSRVLEGGSVFEKAGVNVSDVHGALSEEFAKNLPGGGHDFYATGISLVLHPHNPRAPTVHANFRYIEKGDRSWFGGGADLTPYYLYDEDAVHFHSVWKSACARHELADHAELKKACDEYFFLPHRGEARGIGGIFFDYVDVSDASLAFWRDMGNSFLDAYVPILERRRDEAFGDRERTHQLRRRGRYVEFNLIYDRGTIFGLKTGGRIESILMSLPPSVRWDYDAEPPEGSEEARLLDILKSPRDWVPSD
jgi:coproporphyrinogen III oxidase